MLYFGESYDETPAGRWKLEKVMAGQLTSGQSVTSLSFKGHMGVQAYGSFEDCCPTCTQSSVLLLAGQADRASTLHQGAIR